MDPEAVRRENHPKSKPYDENFYRSQMDGSYRSAARYVEILAEHFRPLSVIDVGCGRGTWLKAFGEAGATRLVGVDGPWNSQELMADPRIEFYAADLDRSIFFAERFDLALSVEVAEHLPIATADLFVTNLTNLSDAVLFGAAYVKQGGSHHINEQPQSYWAEKFVARDYVPFDIFRPRVWLDPTIEFWYQQNTFLYVRTGSLYFQNLVADCTFPLENINFTNCVHPTLFAEAAAEPGFVLRLRQTFAALVAAMRKRVSE